MTDTKLDEEADVFLKKQGELIGNGWAYRSAHDAFKAGASFERARIFEMLRSEAARRDYLNYYPTPSFTADWLEENLK